jgi:hypothetical protein
MLTTCLMFQFTSDNDSVFFLLVVLVVCSYVGMYTYLFVQKFLVQKFGAVNFSL